MKHLKKTLACASALALGAAGLYASPVQAAGQSVGTLHVTVNGKTYTSWSQSVLLYATDTVTLSGTGWTPNSELQFEAFPGEPTGAWFGATPTDSSGAFSTSFTPDDVNSTVKATRGPRAGGYSFGADLNQAVRACETARVDECISGNVREANAASRVSADLAMTSPKIEITTPAEQHKVGAKVHYKVVGLPKRVTNTLSYTYSVGDLTKPITGVSSPFVFDASAHGWDNYDKVSVRAVYANDADKDRYGRVSGAIISMSERPNVSASLNATHDDIVDVSLSGYAPGANLKLWLINRDDRFDTKLTQPVSIVTDSRGTVRKSIRYNGPVSTVCPVVDKNVHSDRHNACVTMIRAKLDARGASMNGTVTLSASGIEPGLYTSEQNVKLYKLASSGQRSLVKSLNRTPGTASSFSFKVSGLAAGDYEAEWVYTKNGSRVSTASTKFTINKPALKASVRTAGKAIIDMNVSRFDPNTTGSVKCGPETAAFKSDSRGNAKLATTDMSVKTGSVNCTLYGPDGKPYDSAKLRIVKPTVKLSQVTRLDTPTNNARADVTGLDPNKVYIVTLTNTATGAQDVVRSVTTDSAGEIHLDNLELETDATYKMTIDGLHIPESSSAITVTHQPPIKLVPKTTRVNAMVGSYATLTTVSDEPLNGCSFTIKQTDTGNGDTVEGKIPSAAITHTPVNGKYQQSFKIARFAGRAGSMNVAISVADESCVQDRKVEQAHVNLTRSAWNTTGSAGAKTVGAQTNLWTTIVSPDLTPQYKTHDGRWVDFGKTISSNGFTYQLVTVNTRTPGSTMFRYKSVIGGETVYSNEVSLTRQPLKASTAGSKRVGEVTNVWGTAPEAGQKVCSQFIVNGRWTTSQCRTANKSGFFAIPLTYGAVNPNTYKVRVVALTKHGWTASTVTSIKRVGLPAAGIVKQPSRWQYTNAWTTFKPAANRKVCSQVYRNGHWNTFACSKANGNGFGYASLNGTRGWRGSYSVRLAMQTQYGWVTTSPVTQARR